MHRRTGAALLAAPVGSRSGGKRIATSATAAMAIAGRGGWGGWSLRLAPTPSD